MKTIEGKVHFINLEGGFWGIIDNDGIKYLPVNPLPEEYLQEGLSIIATVQPASIMGIQMWGRAVDILDIRPNL